MAHINVTFGVAAIAVVAITVACGGRNEQSAGQSAPATSAPVATAPANMPALDITLKTNPDPVRMGENTFEAMVMQDGKPVTDATVSTEFFMAAMPSMNMPEMRTKTDLMHEGNGTYRGKGQVSMTGNWDVTVMVMRGGREIGSKKMPVTVK